jgi:hypothetical protein
MPNGGVPINQLLRPMASDSLAICSRAEDTELRHCDPMGNVDWDQPPLGQVLIARDIWAGLKTASLGACSLIPDGGTFLVRQAGDGPAPILSLSPSEATVLLSFLGYWRGAGIDPVYALPGVRVKHAY